MRNGPGGPWDFWIEMKGTDTPIKPTQARWWCRRIAAGIPVFCLRNSSGLKDVLELVGFPHHITRKDGIDQTVASLVDRVVTMEFCGQIMRRLHDRETEDQAQKWTKTLLVAHGFRVLDTSQGFRPGGPRHATTRMEKGTPDLYVTREAVVPKIWLSFDGELDG